MMKFTYNVYISKGDLSLITTMGVEEGGETGFLKNTKEYEFGFMKKKPKYCQTSSPIETQHEVENIPEISIYNQKKILEPL